MFGLAIVIVALIEFAIYSPGFRPDHPHHRADRFWAYRARLASMEA
jgi:hypothetical protein